MNLILSLFALAAGPFIYAAVRNRPPARSALDGFLFVTISGIVLVHIVPDVFELAGYTAVVFLLLGSVFAILVERTATHPYTPGYSWVVMIGALGLVLHAAVDGIALLPVDGQHGAEGLHLDDHGHGHGGDHGHGHGGDHEHDGDHDHGAFGSLMDNYLALGVVLHRLPVGMAIWWVLRPRMGNAAAIVAFALIAFATAAAYLLGDPVVDMMHSSSVACFQAFVAGTLLHILVFAGADAENQAQGATLRQVIVGDRFGIAAGLLAIFLLPHAH